MSKRKGYGSLVLHLAIAALLWGLMFAPASPLKGHFWLLMSLSGLLLSGLALTSSDVGRRLIALWRKAPARQALLSVGVAALLYGVFVLGDQVARQLFDFAAEGIDSIYRLREGFAPGLIALLLLFIIGPAEEIFWRGYLQEELGRRLARGEVTLRTRLIAFVITTAAYTLIHLWSANVMLTLAALAAGTLWGLLYALKPDWFPAILISHALWDACAFVFFPI